MFVQPGLGLSIALRSYSCSRVYFGSACSALSTTGTGTQPARAPRLSRSGNGWTCTRSQTSDGSAEKMKHFAVSSDLLVASPMRLIFLDESTSGVGTCLATLIIVGVGKMVDYRGRDRVQGPSAVDRGVLSVLLRVAVERRLHGNLFCV